MNEYTFSLPYPPSVNHYWRPSKNGVYISKEGRLFREHVRQVIVNLKLNIHLTSRLKVTFYVSPPDNRRRDIDNCLKASLDALSHAGFWLDDCQIDDLRVVRCEVVKGGGCVVKVRELDGCMKLSDI